MGNDDIEIAVSQVVGVFPLILNDLLAELEILTGKTANRPIGGLDLKKLEKKLRACLNIVDPLEKLREECVFCFLNHKPRWPDEVSP